MNLFFKISTLFLFSYCLSSSLNIEKESTYDFNKGLKPVVDFNKVNEDIDFFIDDNLDSNYGYHLLSKSGEKYLENNGVSSYFYSYSSFYGNQDVTKHTLEKEYDGFSKQIVFYTTPFHSNQNTRFDAIEGRMLILGGQVKESYQDKRLMPKLSPFFNTTEYKKLKHKNDVNYENKKENFFLFKNKPSLLENPYDSQSFRYSKWNNKIIFAFFNDYDLTSGSYYDQRLEKKYIISKSIIWGFFLLFSIFFINRSRNETKRLVQKYTKEREAFFYIISLFKSRKYKTALFEKNSKEIEKLSKKKKEIINKKRTYYIENE